MSCDEYRFHRKMFWKCLVIVYVYLWLQAATYDCTIIASMQLYCNGFIHNVHKKLLKKSVYTLIIYNLHANRPTEELQGLYYSPVTFH